MEVIAEDDILNISGLSDISNQEKNNEEMNNEEITDENNDDQEHKKEEITDENDDNQEHSKEEITDENNDDQEHNNEEIITNKNDDVNIAQDESMEINNESAEALDSAPEDVPRIIGNLNSENYQTSLKEKDIVPIKTDVISPTPSKQTMKSGSSACLSNGQPQLARSMTMRPPRDEEKWTTNDVSPRLKRRSLTSLQMSSQQAERLKMSKMIAETAMKNNKIFTIIGPYKKVRETLRARGWVEKFYKLQGGVQGVSKKSSNAASKSNNNDDDDLDDDDDDDDVDYDDGPIPPWDEDDGIYGIMSRIVRNAEPTFIWSLRKSQVDFRFLKKEQIVNHHAKAGIFTTKVGLCKILRELQWYEDSHCDLFFPRCYILTLEDEKIAFIEDFRRCACMGLIKIIVSGENTFKEKEPEELEIIKEAQSGGLSDRSADGSRKRSKKTPSVQPKIRYFSRRVPGAKVPQEAIDFALDRCKAILQDKTHENLDKIADVVVDDSQWEKFIQWYYMVVHQGAEIEGGESRLEDCQQVSEQLKQYFPQYDMDGVRNVWILKPGAKSRGRGIQCYNRLNDMLKLVNVGTVPKGEYKYIVQKYIERPLLVFNTKFDIRQWFLVTDWNPLTVWMYNKCYVRFCSQQFTLEDFDESVHLSNNSIQHKYENGPRSPFLPADNMWDLSDFKSWLRRYGPHDVWDSVICPGMKSAIVSSLMCSQDYIEVRKNCFELYGADFMITDNYKPYLIEINSSPTMAQSTEVTTRLTSSVIEDTLKVVLDRRHDKHCTVGDYQLIYKQSAVSVPIYSGLDLTISGTHLKKPINQTTAHSQTLRTTVISYDYSSTKNVVQSDNCEEAALTNNVPHKKRRESAATTSFSKAAPPRVYELARAKQERDQEAAQNLQQKERRVSDVSLSKVKPPRCYEIAREKQKELALQTQQSKESTKESNNKENFRPSIVNTHYSHGSKNPVANTSTGHPLVHLDSPDGEADCDSNGVMKGNTKIKEKRSLYPALQKSVQAKSCNNTNQLSMTTYVKCMKLKDTECHREYDSLPKNKCEKRKLQLPNVKSCKNTSTWKSINENGTNEVSECSLFPQLNQSKWSNNSSKQSKMTFKVTTILLNDQYSTKSLYV